MPNSMTLSKSFTFLSFNFLIKKMGSSSNFRKGANICNWILDVIDCIIVSPQNLHVETVTSNRMILGDGAFEGNQVMRAEPLWWYWSPYEKGKSASSSVYHGRTQQEDCCLQQKRALTITWPCWCSDLEFIELWEIKFQLFKWASVWYFIIAAQGD